MFPNEGPSRMDNEDGSLWDDGDDDDAENMQEEGADKLVMTNVKPTRMSLEGTSAILENKRSYKEWPESHK